ncbi:hypothetical protein LCGC14_1981720 [marine sediment metagenome]|uniref:Uncharacterized protein n=1 Tax=marine sediment metagenome TaxID=412755 RepID=A0A0F9HM14_9ZZZZ
MGTKVIIPPVFSPTDCPGCTPPSGSRWEPGETPLDVFVYFESMTLCPSGTPPPPNGRTFRLRQSLISSCLWEFTDASWSISWEAFVLAPLRSRLRLSDTPGFFYFASDKVVCPPEFFVYPNDLTSCLPLRGARDGFAIVTWMDAINQIVFDYNLPTASQLMYEMFVKNGTSVIHKFANQERSLNVKFDIPT